MIMRIISIYSVFVNIPVIKETIRIWRTSTFIRQVVGTFATRIFLIGVGLIISVLTARLLGPEGRGLFAVMGVIGAIGIQFSNLGLHASNTYHVAKSPELLNKLLGNTLFISFGFGGFVIAILWTIFHWIPKWSPLPNLFLFLALISIPLGLSYMLMQNLLLGMQQVRAYNMVDIVVQVLTILLMLVVLIAGIPTVATLYAIGLLASCIGAGWILVFLLKRTNSLPLISMNLFRSSIGYGLKVYITDFASFLVFRVDLLMINYILGAKDTGFFSVASSMANLIYMLPITIGTILFPKLSAMKNGQWQLTLKTAIWVGLMMIPLVVIAALLASPLVDLLYGKVFLPAVDAFVWLMPGIYLISFQTIFVKYLAINDYPINIVYIWVTSVVLNILLNLYLIPSYGIMGASLALTITYAYVTIFILLSALIIRNRVLYKSSDKVTCQQEY